MKNVTTGIRIPSTVALTSVLSLPPMMTAMASHDHTVLLEKGNELLHHGGLRGLLF